MPQLMLRIYLAITVYTVTATNMRLPPASMQVAVCQAMLGILNIVNLHEKLIM